MQEYHPIGIREFEVLDSLLSKLPDNPKILELGVGASTLYFWDFVTKHNGSLVSIDIDEERLNHFVPEGATKILKDSSYKVPTGKFDLIFIDADHRYKYIKDDIETFLPLLSEKGIICGHDYESDEYKEEYIKEDYVEGKHHGVIKAVNERFGQVNYHNSVWWKHYE